MSYSDMIRMAEDSDKMPEFNKIMNDYFLELEKYHPQTYIKLTQEVCKLGVKINICTDDELNDYLSKIHHTDMPELWNVEQTSQVAESIGIDFSKWKYNELTFNYVMNMMRADYYSEFKQMFSTSPLLKQSILDNPGFYAHLAKAWLDDEDAPVDKAIKYIHLVTGEKD